MGDVLLLAVLVGLAVASITWQVRAGWFRLPGPDALDKSARPVLVPVGMVASMLLMGGFAASLGQMAAGIPTPSAFVQTTPTLTQQAQAAAITYALSIPLALGLWVSFCRNPAGIKPAPVLSTRRAVVLGLLTLLLWLPVVWAVGVLGQQVQIFIQGQGPPLLAHELLAQIVHGDAPLAWRLTLILAVVIGAPIVEEVLFRGLLQTGLCRALGSTWLGIGVSGVLFVLMHAGAIPRDGWITAGATLVVLTLALGMTFARTRSIAAPIALHAGFNAVSTAGAFLIT
jgi:membrane protease YdiL (CAAX protease family)